jgi:Adenylate and Guanylate cyclase catalytic domain
MSSNAPIAPETPLQIPTFDGPLSRRIMETHIWAVRGGLDGASAHDLFDGYCQRLVIHGAPLWRAYATMQTLHPQWSGYGYTWRRDINAIQPDQYVRSNIATPEWLGSPAYSLICRARKGELHPVMRRRLEAGPEQRDFLVLDEFFAQGGTDYFAQVFSFGRGDPSQGTGIFYSRGGEVLKFLGDGMLAALPFEEGNRVETCRRSLDAAAETMRELAAVNARAPAGLPPVTVDLALHVGEVLYGNVGAADRLDFTVIGPAVNEVARIEALCEPLGRTVLISAEFAAAVEDVENRLESLGHYNLRGVRETKEIFALASNVARSATGPSR